MNETIDAFLEKKEIAIVGASPKSGNWGLALLKELNAKGYSVYPVNPNHDEVNGLSCYKSVSNLPAEVENLILAVNPDRALEIIKQTEGSGIKRIWLIQGVGQGAYSNEAVELIKEMKLEYVYGFCPMMFFGAGMHRFHFWLRKNFGKTPVEFSN